MDWNAKSDSSILSDENDLNKKARKAKAQPTWLTSFIGAEKEARQDAATLSKLSVKLKGKEQGGLKNLNPPAPFEKGGDQLNIYKKRFLPL